uniref:vomeronasal type-2 receptor 116-like isoform X2 n=1 Tax=Myodes glareolus TaxID=447135 RepID=UPI0020221633|nr:vomeronasal type-2 receptor 116-like isoform X2 [Myodes glareolus]
MFTLIFLIFLLNISLLVFRFTHPRCFWRMNQNKDRDEDMVKGCVFFFGTFQFPEEKDYFNKLLHIPTATEINQFPLAIAFSVDEVNRNPDLLPNASLGFDLLEGDCKTVPQLYSLLHFPEGSLDIRPNYLCDEGSSCVLMLSGPTWTVSEIAGTYVNIYPFQTVIHLTYGPFSPILSDREQFPSVYQMAPQDIYLALAMVSLMLHFNWNWIGLAISDNDQGIQFLSYLRREMEKNTVCFAFVNMIPVKTHSYLSRAEVYYNQIMTSSTKVVVIYGDTDSTLAVSFRRWQSLGIQRIWVTTSQWDVTTWKSDFTLNSFHGTLVFAHHHAEISSFKTFVQTLNPLQYSDEYLARLEWMNLKCELSDSKCKTLKNCISNASLQWLKVQTFDMAFSDDSYVIYNAVYTLAHIFHEMLLQEVYSVSKEDGKGQYPQCYKIHSLLRKTQFTNPVGDRVNMNQKENLQEEYDIFYIWNFPHGLGLKVKIGEFSPHFPRGQQLHLYEDMIEHATGSRQMPPSVCNADCGPGFRKFSQEGMADCCFDCSPCPQNEVSNETTVILGVFVQHRDTPIVKANNRNLTYILLISLIFCFLCTLLFIGYPNSAICILQQVTFGVVFTVAVSTVLAKTVTVLLAFKVTAPGKRKRSFLLSGAPNYIIVICTLIQIILCVIWLQFSPPFIDHDVHSEHDQIIIVCNKGSETAFYCVLGYHGSLALASFIVAFLSRNLPDTFNEAKLLTFSMLLFCSVWVTFIPVYHSTKGKVMVVVEVLSILISSAGLLGCIFVPKCYIILLRPERNSLQKLREKTSF